jgi:hypothetical protein
LKPGVVVTLPSWNDDGYLSPSQFSGAITPSLSLAHSSSTAWAVSRPASSNPGICGDLVDAGQMLDVEQHVLDGCDVAHGVSWEIRYPNTKMGIANDAIFSATGAYRSP